jgi:phospholipid/cholesterol/gamma-HCH transport system substrate-binding protein
VNTQPLNPARIFVVVTFSLTCFCLMLYLWNAFGGSVPLKPKGYRVTVALPEADLLATQADVRISGVTVGHVISTRGGGSSSDPNRKDALLQIDPQYAPLHGDVKAIMRRKSLAGEEFLELTPGNRSTPAIPDNGRLPNANVAPSVDFDEVLRTFDPATRRRLGEWWQAQAASIDGRGSDLNAALGTLPQFETGITQVLTTLNRQNAALRAAVANTGTVFDALSTQQAALHGLVTNGKRATDAFAQQSQAFADTWRALPTFESESRKLLARAEAFRQNADPVISRLRPGFRALGPAAQEVQAIAPDLKGFVQGVDGVTKASVKGLPAARAFFDDVRPFTREFVPFLDQLAPLLGYLAPNIDTLSALVADATAATQPTTAGFGRDGALLHYVRAAVALNPATLATFRQHRLSSNRANPYADGSPRFSATQPLTVFDTANCGPVTWPQLGPADPAAGLTQALRDQIWHFVYNDGQAVAPPCVLQPTPYPHVQALSHTPQGP